MLTLIDASLAYIREMSPQFPVQHATHRHGGADHQAYLERPFIEAQQAIYQRLHRADRPG